MWVLNQLKIHILNSSEPESIDCRAGQSLPDGFCVCVRAYVCMCPPVWCHVSWIQVELRQRGDIQPFPPWGPLPPWMSIHLLLILMSKLTSLLPPWPLWSCLYHLTSVFPAVCLWSLSSSAFHDSHFPLFHCLIFQWFICRLAPSHGKAPSVFSQCSGLQNNPPVWFPTFVFCLGFGIAASIHHQLSRADWVLQLSGPMSTKHWN